jgi:hypothetical protein
MRDKLKEELNKLFEEPDWQEKFPHFYPSLKIDILWSVIELVNEGKFLPQAVWVAEYFSNDPDPAIEDSPNQDVLKGEEVKPIFTVRGTVAWLVGVIVGRLNPTYYPRAIDLLERLCNDEAVYVRQMATYPLTSLIANIKATRNHDGTDFKFEQIDKDRVMRLAFSMLESNKNYPRILEVLIRVFDRMRFLAEEEAMYILKNFLYDKDNEYYPDYVTHNVAPLLIFFAEFRSESFSNFSLPPFNPAAFVTLLKDVIKSAPPLLKTTLVWHFWKTIEDNPKTYKNLKKYIPLFFEGEFQEEPLSQYEFLAEKVLVQSPEEAVWIFKQEISYLRRALEKQIGRDDWTIWFHNPEDIIDAVAQHEPESLTEVLTVLRDISQKRGYIGDLTKIFSSFKKAPTELQERLSKEIAPLYESLRFHNPGLPPL